MPHFFISSKSVNSNHISISDKENYNHIAKSLRIRKGEKLLLIDENQIQYETVVENVTSNEVFVRIENSYRSFRRLDFRLYLAQSPLRSEAQSFVVEKATELGVKGIYPVRTDNCALSDEVIKKKIEKWQKIMLQASKQCERADVPVGEHLEYAAVDSDYPDHGSARQRYQADVVDRGYAPYEPLVPAALLPYGSSRSGGVEGVPYQYGDALAAYRVQGGGIYHLRAEVAELHSLGVAHLVDHIRSLDYLRVGRHEPVHVGPYLEQTGVQGGSQQACRVVGAAAAEVGDLAAYGVGGDEPGHYGYRRCVAVVLESLAYEPVCCGCVGDILSRDLGRPYEAQRIV